MSVCDHAAWCSGAGWAHDAQLTDAEARELGIDRYREVSMKKALRQMRAQRKAKRDAER